MPYQGPDQADLANVFELNSAFIAWQRARPVAIGDQCLPADIRTRLLGLSGEQRQRLARTPFLLMSIAEDDEARWQSIFAEQRTRDLLQCLQVRDEAASRLIAAALAFLWQLARRNPYAARLVSGASLQWYEHLAGCTLMELLSRTLDDQTLLGPRMADEPELWNRLLTAGVSNRRPVRLAVRAAALQTLLTRRPVRSSRPLAAAACRTPAAKIRRSGRHSD